MPSSCTLISVHLWNLRIQISYSRLYVVYAGKASINLFKSIMEMIFCQYVFMFCWGVDIDNCHVTKFRFH